MLSNLDRYKKDFELLITDGLLLDLAMRTECYPEELAGTLEKEFGEKAKKVYKHIPSFKDAYQRWYTQAKVLIKQLVPDRLIDFARHYEKPKLRKDITVENYTIEDYLQGLTITRGLDKENVVGPYAAIPKFRQQLAILNSVKARFESSLFDIRQLVQADLFDSELEAAKELAKHGFLRAAGAVAGVVLEKHLGQVACNHAITTRKQRPTISDLNDLLKSGGVLDIPAWRNVQRLGDLRNLSDHNKQRDPTAEEIIELINGVEKISKTLF